MTDEDDRRAITAAMPRLFAGTPLRSSGKLDIVSLAQEAGVKQNKLTHKHTDLKLAPTNRPDSANGDETLQVTRARAAVPVRVQRHLSTLPAPPASALGDSMA